MWRLVELSARHELPFQIHTGQGRIQGSNPMLLVDLIEANPRPNSSSFMVDSRGSARQASS